MSSKVKRLLKTIRAETEEWLEAPRTLSQRQRAEGKLQDFLRGKGGTASLSFEILSQHHLTSGTAAVLAGDGAGWESIDLGFQLAHAGIGLGGNRMLQRIAPILAHAASARRDSEAEEIGRVLLDSYSPDSAVADLYPFVRFAVALWQVQSGTGVVEDVDLGPFQATWHLLRKGEPTELGAELSTVADRHLEHARDLGSNEPDFIMGYELLPVDVLWILRVRDHLGLKIPGTIEHPLMALPTGTPPEHWPHAEPKGLLADALGRARARFGSEL